MEKYNYTLKREFYRTQRKNIHVFEILRIPILIALVGWCFILYSLFLGIYFSPTKSGTIYLNNFNEAFIEFVIWPPFLVLGVALLTYEICKFKDQLNYSEKF